MLVRSLDRSDADRESCASLVATLKERDVIDTEHFMKVRALPLPMYRNLMFPFTTSTQVFFTNLFVDLAVIVSSMFNTRIVRETVFVT